MTPFRPFEPPRLLRSGHTQTVLGSRGRSPWIRRRAAPLLDAACPQLLEGTEGVRLQAWLSLQPKPAPAVVLIHGWLGHANSSYVLSSAAALWHAGFSVVRLNLRDHGDTAHLNEGLFHSARITEVIDAIELLADRHLAVPCGLVGYSLGGNFALRVARALDIETVAICPAVDPPATMQCIDTGLAVYRWFFMTKWQKALTRKQQAFPHRYDFTAARGLSTVGALTDLFVAHHTSFGSTDAYFQAYSLTGTALQGVRATVIYAEDDPVIPASGFSDLPDSLTLVPTSHGGHCAFVERPWQPTWTDDYLVRHFRSRLMGVPSRHPDPAMV